MVNRFVFYIVGILFKDENVVAPYTYKGDQWLGYDDEKSFEVKANYILENGLAGAMVWSIDTDDFKGFCGRENGLINTLAEVKLNPAL